MCDRLSWLINLVFIFSTETLLDTKDTNITACLETIKVVVLCGEVVTMALRDRFVDFLPNVKLINLYSISECHDVAGSDLSAGELEKVPLLCLVYLLLIFCVICCNNK